MIYEEIINIPIFKKAYKSYRISFHEKVKCTKFPIRGRFRCRVIENKACTA